MGPPLMYNIKTHHINRYFAYVMLVFVVVFLPFLGRADHHDIQSDKSNVQQSSDVQNQNPAPLTRQEFRDVLSEQQEWYVTQPSWFMYILGFLFLLTLTFLIWTFFKYRIFARKLDDVRYQIDNIAKETINLKQTLVSVNNRIQTQMKSLDLEEFYRKISAEYENNISKKIVDLLKPIIVNHQNHVSFRSYETMESSQQNESGITEEGLPPAIIEFCNQYNAGIRDINKQDSFLVHYQEHYKIYVENSMDRRVNQQIDPVFKTDSAAGNFLACYIEMEKSYAVVPVYRLRLEYAILHHGAFIDVFNCPDLDQNACYEVVKIIQPAIFEPDDAKETWKLKEKGILELQET